MKHRVLVSTLLTMLAVLPAAAQVPRPAPEYTVKVAGGKPVKLSQLKGKVVVLEFLLSYCAGCQRAAQTMQKFQNEFGASRLAVYGVAFDEANDQKIAQFRTKSGARFPIGVDLDRNVYGFLQHSAMLPLLSPSVAFIDKKGVIRAQFTGADQQFIRDEEKMSRDILVKLLKEK